MAYTTTTLVRNYFDPALSASDMGDTAITAKIDSVSAYIDANYEPANDSYTQQACLLMVVSQILKDRIGSKFRVKVREEMNDFGYHVGGYSSETPTSEDLWNMAIKILNARVPADADKSPWCLTKVNG